MRRYDEYVVIEEAVAGRELEIGVLGWPELRASVPGEIKPSHDFYDFEDKYLDGAAGLEVPARLPDGVAEEMGRLAVAACRALRVDCMARVDFFFEEGGRGLLINEVNTIPGFTPISMYPRMWEASGVPYPALDRRAGRPGPAAGRTPRPLQTGTGHDGAYALDRRRGGPPVTSAACRRHSGRHRSQSTPASRAAAPHPRSPLAGPA